ncbi:MAG: hypothetical protein ACRD94_01045 [Nitrosopumilaceae archaeon]
MKKIPQNLLFLIICIAVVLVIVTVFGVFATPAPLSRQAIHIHDNTWLKLSNPNGLLKISEMRPNSMAWFWYPDPDRFKDRDPFQKFLLIRLPDYLGGAVNDASAFRAYSALDPSSHCIIKYWPDEGRKRIEDPCGGSMYEPVAGHVLQIGGNPVLVSKNFALPYLELSSDENGYLYVEPPVFTEDKNGAIGIGRIISQQEIDLTSKFIAEREKQIRDAMERFPVPDQFSTGDKLTQISDDGIRRKIAEYVHPDTKEFSILLYYEYCNCTKTKELLMNEESRSGSQLVEFDGIPIVAYPNSMNYVSGIHDDYTFTFYNNGYRISLHTNQKLDSGLNLGKELLELVNK